MAIVTTDAVVIYTGSNGNPNAAFSRKRSVSRLSSILIGTLSCVFLMFCAVATSPAHAASHSFIQLTPQNMQHYSHRHVATSAAYEIQSAANGLYVSAELGYTGSNASELRARASVVGPWERYNLIYVSSGAWAIQSTANGLYVSTELGYTGSNASELRARASVVGPWERYYLYYDTGTGHYILASAANGLYVSAELGYTGSDYGELRARASVVGPWEQYNLYYGL